MDIRSLFRSSFVRINLVTFVHFTLITFGLSDGIMHNSYSFYNILFIVSLFWGIHSKKSTDAIYTIIAINAVSILFDIIVIVRYMNNQSYERDIISITAIIINLLLRPFTLAIFYLELKARGGTIVPEKIFTITDQKRHSDQHNQQNIPPNPPPTASTQPELTVVEKSSMNV